MNNELKALQAKLATVEKRLTRLWSLEGPGCSPVVIKLQQWLYAQQTALEARIDAIYASVDY